MKEHSTGYKKGSWESTLPLSKQPSNRNLTEGSELGSIAPSTQIKSKRNQFVEQSEDNMDVESRFDPNLPG